MMRTKVVLILGLAIPSALYGQPEVQSQKETVAATYAEGANVTVQLRGTERLPEGTGSARVRRGLGATEIRLDLRNMRPAISFGGDFNTYVLWTIAPEGATVNAGEIVLDGARGRLNVTTPLMTFGLFVTAEPHFLVQRPSGFFVLENTIVGLAGRRGVSITPFTYDTIRTDYRYKHSTLEQAPAARGRLRTERFQAIIAVRLASEADAHKFAPEVFAQAQEALGATQQAFAQGVDDRRLAPLAHRAIRLAVEARQLAEERSESAALAAERKGYEGEIARLTRAREQAEEAAARAAAEAAVAQESAQKAKAQFEELEDKMFRANLEADRLARMKLDAQRDAELARQQAIAAYVRLENALNKVAATEETARGLIVSLPDILFDSGRSTLRSEAREVLSRIAGVLLVIPEYRLSIEGHTDSTGRRELNQRLSEQRAASVRDYLAEAQISPALMTTAGFADTRPVASNATPAGRQQNRRVEILIEGLTR